MIILGTVGPCLPLLPLQRQQSLMTATTVRREIPAARTEDPFELQFTASGEGSAVRHRTPTSGPLEASIRGGQGVDRSMSRIGPFPDHNTGFELGPGQVSLAPLGHVTRSYLNRVLVQLADKLHDNVSGEPMAGELKSWSPR